MKSAVRRCNSFPRAELSKKPWSGSALAPALRAPRPECPGHCQERAGRPLAAGAGAGSRMHSPGGREAACHHPCSRLSVQLEVSWVSGAVVCSGFGTRPAPPVNHNTALSYNTAITCCQVMCCRFA